MFIMWLVLFLVRLLILCFSPAWFYAMIHHTSSLHCGPQKMWHFTFVNIFANY